MTKGENQFKNCLIKIGMLIKRVHSTPRLLPITKKINDSIDATEDEIPQITDDLVKLLVDYCVSNTEANTTKQMLNILSELDDNLIKPLNLVEGKNVLESGHFLGEQKDLILEYKVGDTVWFIDGSVYGYAPKDLIEGGNTLEEGHFIGKHKELIKDKNVGDTVWFIDGSVYDYAPKDLIEGKNTLEKGHFIGKHKELIKDKNVGDVVWFVDGIVTDTDPSIVKVTGVKLDKKTASLEIGGVVTLVASLEPTDSTNKNIKFISSKPSIATVGEKDGKVTAITNGTCDVTVTTEDGNFTDKCVVTVDTKVKSVKLNKNTLSLEIGGTETLASTITPNNATDKTVKYSSSKPSIATVGEKDGKVTAIANGTCDITVTTEDGNFTDKCAVTVDTKVKSVKFTKNTETLDIDNKTKTLAFTVSPNNATDKTVTMTSSKPTKISVDNSGKITLLDDTETVNVDITVSTKDGNFTDKCVVTYTKIEEVPPTEGEE